MWLGKDQFLANADAKPCGSNMKRSDSSSVSRSSLKTKKFQRCQTCEKRCSKRDFRKLIGGVQTLVYSLKNAWVDFGEEWSNRVWRDKVLGTVRF